MLQLLVILFSIFVAVALLVTGGSILSKSRYDRSGIVAGVLCLTLAFIVLWFSWKIAGYSILLETTPRICPMQ